MELKLNIDIESAITAALTPEKIGPAVEKAVSDCVKDALREVFGYNGLVRKRLEAQFADLMPHGLDDGDAARFQAVLQNTVRDAVIGANAETVQLAITKSVGEMMGTETGPIKLSELLQIYKNDLYAEDCNFYAQLEDNDDGYFHLYLNKEPLSRHGSQYSAQTRMGINKKGCVYSLEHDGTHFTPSTLPSAAISSIDVTLLALYVGRRHLVIDMTPDEVEDFAHGGHDHD